MARMASLVGFSRVMSTSPELSRAASSSASCCVDSRRSSAGRRNTIEPSVILPARSRICMIARAVTLLPLPLSPTTPSTVPR